AAVAAALALTALAGRFGAAAVACALVALTLGLLPRLAPRTSAGAGLGLVLFALGLAIAAQAAAPEAAFIIAWPLLLAAAAAAAATFAPARLAWVPGAAVTAVGGGWLLLQSHHL